MTSLQRIQRNFRIRNLFLLMVFALSGCVQISPVPGYARKGDAVVFGLGGIVRNAQGEQNLTINDLQITITDSANATYTLTPEMVFKAYPDYVSALNQSGVMGDYSSRPFDGGWFVKAQLAYPWDNVHQGEPLPLAAGPAVVHIVSSKLTNTLSGLEGDLTQIPLEILAGTGSSDQNYNAQIAAYTPIPHVEIRPSTLSGVTAAGGLQLVVNFSGSSSYRSNKNPLVLPFNHHPYLQLAQHVVDNGGTKTITVLLTTQNAFVTTANQTAETLSLADLSLQLMYFPVENATPNPLQDFSIDVTKSKYIDASGNVIPNVYPVLSVH